MIAGGVRSADRAPLLSEQLLTLDLRADGACLHPGAANALLFAIECALAAHPVGRAGLRLHGNPALAALLDASSPIGLLAAEALGRCAAPVRAVLFDKTPTTNWALGWHQDRTIAVTERRDIAGFGPWSIKRGIQYVEPPFELIERMVTLRIHLDPVPAENAPLLIAPGSHRLGRIPVVDVAEAVARCGTAMCLAERGEVWAYSTPILHASAASSGRARRVLQVDYSDDRLPDGLAWLGL